jgi:hypothetical protein
MTGGAGVVTWAITGMMTPGMITGGHQKGRSLTGLAGLVAIREDRRGGRRWLTRAGAAVRVPGQRGQQLLLCGSPQL